MSACTLRMFSSTLILLQKHVPTSAEYTTVRAEVLGPKLAPTMVTITAAKPDDGKFEMVGSIVMVGGAYLIRAFATADWPATVIDSTKPEPAPAGTDI